MRPRTLGLALIAIIGLALLIVTLLRDPAPVPLAAAPPLALTAEFPKSTVRVQAPQLEARAIVPIPAVVRPTQAENPSTTSADSKERWGGIPLDTQGRTLGTQGQTAFRQTLVKFIKPELRHCMDMLPPDKDVPELSVELFVEATGDGFLIQRAEIPPDAGLDAYERRCFEGAFEKRIPLLEDSRNTSGQLFHLGFPLRISPPMLASGDGGV